MEWPMTEPGAFELYARLQERRRRIARELARKVAQMDDADTALRMWMTRVKR